MSPELVELLRAEVARLGSQTAAAKVMGVSHSAVSLILKGKYPAKDASAMAARIRGLRGVDCPYLGRRVEPEHCRATALGSCPTYTPEARAAWIACQSCPHRPPAPAAQAARSKRSKRHAVD